MDYSGASALGSLDSVKLHLTACMSFTYFDVPTSLLLCCDVRDSSVLLKSVEKKSFSDKSGNVCL